MFHGVRKAIEGGEWKGNRWKCGFMGLFLAISPVFSGMGRNVFFVTSTDSVSVAVGFAARGRRIA